MILGWVLLSKPKAGGEIEIYCDYDVQQQDFKDLFELVRPG